MINPLAAPATSDRRTMRFVAFGIAIILGMGGLTARLFYLQIVTGTHYETLAQVNRTVLQAVASTRGLVYDRNGKPLISNVPSYAVKIRPSDLPESQRDDVVQRLGGLLGLDPADINSTIDANPGSRFDLVRIAQDVPEATARLISESRLELPGVEVDVEARRQYLEGTLMSQLLGYTGPINAGQLANLRASGYQPDDLIGETGIEAQYEQELRGTYGVEQVERDAQGRKIQVLSTVQPAQAGDSLVLTIDTHEQELAQKALEWAMRAAGLKRGVLIAMNPQTGEILAMVSLPTYDDNLFARGISTKDFQKLVNDPNKPLMNQAIQGQFPPGSTYKLVAGTGALADKKITATTRLRTRGLSDPRTYPLLRLEPSRLRPVQHLLRLRPLVRHVLLPGRRDAGHRPARVLGTSVRLRTPDGHRSPGRGESGSSPRTSGRWTRSASRSFRARSIRRASGRATTSSRRCS